MITDTRKAYLRLRRDHPVLVELENVATAATLPHDGYCVNAYWYGYACTPWHRRGVRDLLAAVFPDRGSDTYGLAYSFVYDMLPDCGCWRCSPCDESRPCDTCRFEYDL